MTGRNKALKTLALAAVGALGLLAFRAGPVSAHEVYTRCDADGDHCWRVICDDDGDDCHPARHEAYYDGPPRYWVCDDDGDDCHWGYGPPPRRYYHPEPAGPRVFFGLGIHH